MLDLQPDFTPGGVLIHVFGADRRGGNQLRRAVQYIQNIHRQLQIAVECRPVAETGIPGPVRRHRTFFIHIQLISLVDPDVKHVFAAASPVELVVPAQADLIPCGIELQRGTDRLVEVGDGPSTLSISTPLLINLAVATVSS